MTHLDPRLNAIRPDLADVMLKGRVEASRFVAGAPMRVVAPQAPLRRQPSDQAPLDTEALCGEPVAVFETRQDGWAWAQLLGDRYVGWMPLNALGPSAPGPTHKVSALRTLVFAEPDIKSPVLAGLPFGTCINVAGEAEDANARYALLASGGAVVVQHIAPLGVFERDWTAVAGRFLGVPYLWGGKTSLGLDCSGLVQVALAACGIAAPRDTDMQAEATGKAVPLAALGDLGRGDLVFWKGHVGIICDARTLLHANAHHMQVACEPFDEAEKRLSRRGLTVTAIRRPVAD